MHVCQRDKMAWGFIELIIVMRMVTVKLPRPRCKNACVVISYNVHGRLYVLYDVVVIAVVVVVVAAVVRVLRLAVLLRRALHLLLLPTPPRARTGTGSPGQSPREYWNTLPLLVFWYARIREVQGGTPFEQVDQLRRRGMVWVVSVIWVSKEAFC